MAEVTGFTADRMRVIENETVVDGEIQGDDLVLMTRQGMPINAGNVRGPKGDQGNPGTPGQIQSVNNQIGDVFTPRVFADKAALDLWTTAPAGTHAYTSNDRGEWVRVGTSWLWVASPRLFTSKASLDLEIPYAPDGARAYTVAEDVDWIKSGGVWRFNSPPRIFASASAIASSWWGANAPIGALATTADTGCSWKRIKVGAGAEWVPFSASYSGVHNSLGGFPAGGYSWPASPTNIAGYGPGSAFFYTGGLTQYTGLYTVTATLYITPSDGGDYSIYLTMAGEATSNTTSAVFACASCTMSQGLGPGQQIKWSMYKAANTAALTGSSIRFTLAFESAI